MSTDISLDGRWKLWVFGHHLSTKVVRRGPSMSGRPALIALANPRKLAHALKRYGV
jgi:cobalamin biosynthesis protein CobT